MSALIRPLVNIMKGRPQPGMMNIFGKTTIGGLRLNLQICAVGNC